MDTAKETRDWVHKQPWYRERSAPKTNLQITVEGKAEYLRVTGKEYEDRPWKE